ncbi:3-oxoadipyl-CoA thiolase [Oceanimonas sp. NS1]|nr:3-oxoadipyl-CoA thiolase [Oceanimonas sp. NS1]
MTDAFLCDMVRTPVGRYGGALSAVRADDLAAIPLRRLKENHPDLPWEKVDEVIMGCANQAGEDNRNVARMAALLAELPTQVPGTTVNRLCGSGLDAIGFGARSIKAGEARLVLAGGVESMSRAPFVMPKATGAFSRANEVHDTTIGWRFVNPLMKAQYGVDSMPETAENVAERFGISREDQDLFALRSQQKTEQARASGILAQGMVPVLIHGRKGQVTEVSADEHPRPRTTLDDLARLPTPFRAGGSVTAGNASGVNDGAACTLLASGEAVAQYGLKPKARIVAMASAGVEPKYMGIGPVPAVRNLLENTGLSLNEMDVIELNEAFAAQALAVLRELGLQDDDARVNPNGGAISLGHPLGMSGVRLVMAAVNGLKRTGGRYGLCTMCVGVGQGVALIVENID